MTTIKGCHATGDFFGHEGAVCTYSNPFHEGRCVLWPPAGHDCATAGCRLDAKGLPAGA